MTVFDAIFLFVAGFLSGVVNAIAGGGTFLTFGAMTLTGLPPIVANATSSITQFPGYVTSTLAYAKEIRADWKEAALLGGLSLVGGLAGALLLLSLSNPSFRALVPWLLLAATAIFAAGPYLKPKTLSPEKPISPLGLAGQFVTSIYGGFFGAGMGIMTLAVLGLTKGGDYHRLNALKNFVAVVIAAMSSGASAEARCAMRDCQPGETCARPRRTASSTRRAARSALMDVSDVEAMAANRRASVSCRPRTRTLRCDPVRISPGHAVVTTIPSRASSAWRPSDSATAANLPTQYGTR